MSRVLVAVGSVDVEVGDAHLLGLGVEAAVAVDTGGEGSCRERYHRRFCCWYLLARNRQRWDWYGCRGRRRRGWCPLQLSMPGLGAVAMVLVLVLAAGDGDGCAGVRQAGRRVVGVHAWKEGVRA